MNLASKSPASAGAQAECSVPQALKQGKSVSLKIMPFAQKTKLPKTSLAEKTRFYWGSSDTVRPGQPQLVRDDEAAYLASQKSCAIWSNARPVPQDASAAGVYRLSTNYCGSASLALGPAQDFLGPISLANLDGQLDLSRALKVQWKSVTGAKAYFLSAIGSTPNGPVLWNSSESETGYSAVTNPVNAATGSLQLDKLIKNKVLLGPDATSCVIPAGVLEGAKFAMLKITAIGANKVNVQNGVEARVIVLSTLTAPLTYRSAPGLPAAK